MPFSLDQRFITKTEEKLGATFPESYSAAMRENNGGSVRAGSDEWRLYPILDTSDKKRLKRTSNDVIRETHSATSWPGFPPAAIAIGANGSGDQLIFLRNADHLGPEVLWWDHETGTIHHVADDFAALPKCG